MEAISSFRVGEDPYFKEQRRAGTLDHDIIEVKAEWMSGHGNSVVRERLRKPGNNAKREWSEYYSREWRKGEAWGEGEERKRREEYTIQGGNVEYKGRG